MEHVIHDLLAEPGSLIKGPYVSLKMPFRSGTRGEAFAEVPLGHTPHHHQELAFARLGGRRKLSTLVATGTGSGKTECFLLPILDHCLSEVGSPGVKAILIYPMNALANDQAGRLAAMIHGNDGLRGRVRAGLYIGQDRGGSEGERSMGATKVITDRKTMQQAPPDILLTNYKMLDYLLLRPDDQGIWQHNHRGTLRYLVVDEIHTFDGAQGTDLACLIRRLKRRLHGDDGSLCCVGTSATLGGPTATEKLCDYANKVFGEPFDDQAVIVENRLSAKEYLADTPRQWFAEPGPEHLETLDPAQTADPEAWLQDQAALWFEEPPGAGGPEWAVELGQRLKHHATFHQLLLVLDGPTLDLDQLVTSMARQRKAWRKKHELGRRSLSSLLGLVAAARSGRDQRAPQGEGESPRPKPLLDLRLQLWQRELRRMVATVGQRPRLRHSSDLDGPARRRHLPLVHCRECGAMGWATLVQRDKPHLMSSDIKSFYRGFFAKDSRVRFLFPSAAVPAGDPNWKHSPFQLDTQTLTRVAEDEHQHSGELLEVIQADNLQRTAGGLELSRDCPFCFASGSLTIVGFQATTLTSVHIDQLFASPFNDDKKLLIFSDSVQDAAHRAGFFGARTWRSNLRIAMLQMIKAHPRLSLAELANGLGQHWRQRLDSATWVATFLAPNMTWLHDWDELKRSGQLPPDSDLERLIERRLAFEVAAEFGLQAGIGRSLPNTGTATVGCEHDRLETAVTSLLAPLHNEVPGLATVTRPQVLHFVLGLLHHLRSRGGIYASSLPAAVVESSGKDVHSFKRDRALPDFRKTSRLPTLLSDRAQGSFATWGGASDGGWYSGWVRRCLASDQALGPDAFST